jgi:O-antigen ligase
VRLTDAIVRGVALAASVALLAYPVRTFLGLDGLPLLLRLAWIVAAVAAIAAPHVSLLAFLVCAPLLPTVPYLMGWPRVPLAEIWLFALLAPAALQVVLGRRDWRADLPAAVPLLALIATASLVVTLHPFHLAAGGFGPLTAALHQFAREDLVLTVSQRHPYASVIAWTILIEGLALLWLIASHTRPSTFRQAQGRPEHSRGTTGSGRPELVEGRGQRDAARRVCELLVAAAFGAVLVALHGIVQWWSGRHLLESWVATDPQIRRVNATFTDPNGLGAYLAMSLWLVIAAAAIGPERRWRISWIVASVAVAAALVFTASRAAWAAAAIGAVLFVGLFLRQSERHGPRARRLRRLASATLLAGVVAVGGLTVLATRRDVRHGDQRTYVHTLLYTLNLNTPLDERLKGRLALWAAAQRMMAERPEFGIGIGRYYKALYAYAPDRDRLVSLQENAHNYFLQVGAELGIVGLLALVGVLAISIRSAILASRDHVRGALALASGVGIVTYVVTWLTGHPLLVREGQFAFWPVIAGALRLHRTMPAVRAPVPAWTRNGAWVAAAVIVALVPWRAARETRQVRLGDLTFGMYDREVDHGRSYNWSTARATFYVPSNARAFTVPLRSLAPMSQTVRVFLDGQLVNELRLTDHAWHRLRSQLPPGRRAVPTFYRVEIVVDPAWRPSEADTRPLGVMIGEREVTP